MATFKRFTSFIFCIFVLAFPGVEPIAAQEVSKPCSRIEGVYVPCGGGGGGCGCPTKNDCSAKTFERSCTSSYDGSIINVTCPTCCFESECNAVKNSIVCNKSRTICGQSCKGTLPRPPESCNSDCVRWEQSSYTDIETTPGECLEYGEREEFSCNSSGSSDGCTCSCIKSGSSCIAKSSGNCGGQCSCGKTGSTMVKYCIKSETLCVGTKTIACKKVKQTLRQIPGPDCNCVCPPEFTPSDNSILTLPPCKQSASCNPGQAI